MDPSEQTRLLAIANDRFRRNDYANAVTALKQVLAASPGNAKANELMAYIAGNTGNATLAHQLLEKAALDPQCSAEALYYLGTSYLRQQRSDEAIRSFEAAIAKAGEFFEVLHDLGAAQALAGQKAAARDSFAKAGKLRTNSPQLWFNLGRLEDELGNHEQALAHYDNAIRLKPDHAESYYNKGVTLTELHRHAEALEHYDRCLRLDPARANAWAARGAVLCELGRRGEALASYGKSLKLAPGVASTWANLGVALSEIGRHAEAATKFEKALAIDPTTAHVAGNLLYARMHVADWNGFDDAAQRIAGSLADGVSVVLPFAMLSIADDPAMQLKAATEWVERAFPPTEVSFSAEPTGSGRIRLGYFSTDFRDHPVAFLTAGLFEAHDRERFEVFAFSLGGASTRDSADDSMRARLREAFDHFIDVEGRSDADVARMSRERGIDIAIDLNGHTQGARTAIFAHRAAPVQVNYLGYPGTMGAPYVDYIIADRYVAPDDADIHFSERLVRLPHSFQVNDSKRQISSRRFSRYELGLPDDAFVYCSFVNTPKITPHVFEAWMSILKRVDHSVLWLLAGDATTTSNLQRAAEQSGVSGERLVFADRLEYPEYLARYRVADLLLDTLPFNAGTTASDALWAGLPVLTRSGKSFAGRMAGSLLRAAGLPELVTSSEQNYVAQAVDLARDSSRLRSIRERLDSSRLTTPLFDTRRFTRNIEAAYMRMHERRVANLEPASFDVEDANQRCA